MSQWAPEPSAPIRSDEVSSHKNVETPSEHPTTPSGKGLTTPWWIRVVPFFLSAIFFLSALFSVFAPLPIMLLQFRSGRRWAWLGIVTNSILVALAGGIGSLAVYLVFIAVLAVTLSELLLMRKSLEKAVVFTFLAILLTGVAGLMVYAHYHHVNPISEFQRQITSLVDYVAQSVQQGSTADIEEWKQNLIVEFPSALAVFTLVLIFVNLVILLKANPKGIRERMGLDAAFIRYWRAPEYLVWPTILAGFLLLVNAGSLSTIALNVFKLLMAIYAIQGLSILSFFFDIWKIRGIFRAVGFVIATFLMMPLLLSLGFFDLWFDFRSKFRHS